MLVSRLTRSVAVAVASLALLAPVAGAMPAPDPIHVPATQTPQFAVSETASQTLPGGRPANAPVPAEHSSDYSWGSTAVYAGIALLVVLMTAALTIDPARRRRRTPAGV